MQVFTRTISSVFGNEKRYVIPLFQRPYVWTEENQWAPLWDDILDKAVHELGTQPTDSPPHFLGAIVIQQRKSWGDQLLAHDVIDGQQRLTTFQLLLAAFRDIAEACGERQVASWLVTLTRNANAIADPEIEQFKIWPTSRDVEQFRLVINAGGRAAIEKVYPQVYKRRRLQPRPRMVEAYMYFYEAMERWLKEGGTTEITNRCRALRRVIDRQLQLVSIELDGQEEPQAIFETLNARGVPLLASDLLRNYIFQRAGSPDEAERLHQAYWVRFEIPNDSDAPDGQRFWEVEERMGRLLRARLDLFVQHYLAMNQQKEIVGSRLYAEYKAWIEAKRPRPTVEDELKELTLFADHFYSLVRPDTSTPLGRFAARLKVLDISTIYPLVLGLLGMPELPDQERIGIFHDLESFLVRRLICGRTTRNARLFLYLLRDFKKGPFTRAAFSALLAAGTDAASEWPDDTKFKEEWLKIDAYAKLKSAQVELILRGIERWLHGPKAEAITIEGTLSIEHIMPQAWKTHWPLPAGIDADAATEERLDLVEDFGNLTLLTRELNSSVSNGPAAAKLPEIAKQSTLLLNSYFQGRKAWSEKDILERSAALFEMARQVWPRPS